MKLKQKLMIIMMVIGVVPALIIGLSTTAISERVIKDGRLTLMESLRDTRADAIKSYLLTVQNQVSAYAVDEMVIGAVEGFTKAFEKYADNTQTDQYKPALNQFYDGKFLPRLKKYDPSSSLTTQSLVGSLSPNAIALQHDFMLSQGGEGSEYGKLHNVIHPELKSIYDRFEFYDIFLVSKTGDVVYTVAKEVDFGVSLKDGMFANSGLAEAFRRGSSLPAGSDAVLVDFAPYAPSYNEPASFIAAPIYHYGKLEGVLVFQFSLDKISNVMGSRTGLGETGETFLVGKDQLLRSDSYNEPQKYSVKEAFREPSKHKMQSEPVKRALSGATGVEILTNYLGNEVLSAYMPLNVAGFEWALVANIDKEETFQEINDMRWVEFVILGGLLLVVGFVGFQVSRIIMRPLGGEPAEMEAIAKRISQGDLTMSFHRENQHPSIYNSMAAMVERLKTMVSDITLAANQQAESAIQLNDAMSGANASIKAQQTSTDQVSHAMSQMVQTVSEVSKTTTETADAANVARANVQSSVEQVKQSSDSIQQVSTSLNSAKTTIESLQKSAHDIAGIMDSIKGIADQTNLLALNAAIEAARAGEQGRGFAVVADEVRSLAQSTQDSTEEIANMITNLLKGTDHAGAVMQENVESGHEVSVGAIQTAENLQEAVISVQKIDDMMCQISSAAEEQAAVSEDINRKVSGINQTGSEVVESMQVITDSAANLSKISQDLQEMVSHFKTA